MGFWSNWFGGKPKPPKPPANTFRAIAINTVPNAQVKLDQVGEGVTNADGYYCWREVSSAFSDQHVWVTAEGYEPYDQHITLTTGALATNQDIFVGDPRWSGPRGTDINLPPLTAIAVEPPPVDPVDPVDPGENRLKGVIRILSGEKGFTDDTGQVNPVFCHVGDLVSLWCRGKRDIAHEIMRDVVKAGYHGIRAWTVLGMPGQPYWAGREVGPHIQADYWQQIGELAAAFQRYELYWLISQGDMAANFTSTNERCDFMRKLAETVKPYGIGFGVDGGNEAWQNGEADPNRLRAIVDAFRDVYPLEVWSLTDGPEESKENLDKYDGSVYDVHGYRGGHSWDKTRHIFSIPYEGKPERRLGIQSEPTGPGKHVSVTDNKEELNTDVQCLLAIQSTQCRQVWVYFSGPGVKSVVPERLQDMPGFWDTPAAVALLPKDVMAFSSLVHGGATQRGRRVFAVTRDDHTRADHAISSDGRFTCIQYGPSWQTNVVERPYEPIVEKTFGTEGRFTYGRIL
jgi:hypothetical protein